MEKYECPICPGSQCLFTKRAIRAHNHSAQHLMNDARERGILVHPADIKKRPKGSLYYLTLTEKSTAII